MKQVTKEELAAMDNDSDRCALELSDADVGGEEGVRASHRRWGWLPSRKPVETASSHGR